MALIKAGRLQAVDTLAGLQARFQGRKKVVLLDSARDTGKAGAVLAALGFADWSCADGAPHGALVLLLADPDQDRQIQSALADRGVRIRKIVEAPLNLDDVFHLVMAHRES